MSYLVSMLLIAVAIGFFLSVIAIFERGQWPSNNAGTVETALRELFAVRRNLRLLRRK